MKNIPYVIKDVVNNDLCIGCGACVQACPSKALDVQWNEYGFLVASSNKNSCDTSGACLEVCPFNPQPDADYKNEDGLAEIFLTDSQQRHEKIGRYHNLYAGYSRKFRETSSSGGIATFVYEELLDKGLIDHIVTVGDSDSDTAHYQYKIISSKDELLNISKTRYHPVTLAHALEAIKTLEGRVAISGVGCFIKAIRLAQQKDPILKEKIAFLVGIICGGVKSKFFTEYLASKTGIKANKFSKPEYRVKDATSIALDYGFSCIDEGSKTTRFIKMREVGDMWGTGLFKANACDYCDDITTELADISLGDAWLEPFSSEGLGNSVIITRTNIAENLIHNGANKNDLTICAITANELLSAQQGNIRHRIYGYKVRLDERRSKKLKTPKKRHMLSTISFDTYLVQKLRRLARKNSLYFWAKEKNSENFEKRMKPTLLALKIATRISSEKRNLTNRINGK